MSTSLIIDADTLVYKAARGAETVVQWDEDLHTAHAELDEGIESLLWMVEAIEESLDGDAIVMALSDYDRPNWRQAIYPEYKTHREALGIRRPLLWSPLREYIHEMNGHRWRTYQKPGLEGDDVCGILMTAEKGPAKRVCVSIDKDLNTVPGLHYNPDKPEEGVYLVTPEYADRFHLIQALSGDSTDGYPGCPGIGPKRAAELLDGGRSLEAFEHTLKSGPRKGEVETRWRLSDDPCYPWDIVVTAYERAGLGEEEALVNARCARILRASDYNFETQEVILWTP